MKAICSISMCGSVMNGTDQTSNGDEGDGGEVGGVYNRRGDSFGDGALRWQ